jgi:hypothetical protein
MSKVFQPDARHEKLSINTMSLVLPDSPDAADKPERIAFLTLWSSMLPELYDKFFPVLVSTGIFEKTPIKKFHTQIVFTDATGPSQSVHKIGRDKIHVFEKAFRYRDVPLKEKDELVVFCLRLMAEGLFELCLSKDLDSTEVQKLLAEIGSSSKKSSSAVETVEDLTEEVEIWIKLKSEFGEPDELIKNTQVIAFVSHHLEKAGVGHFDATESGGGYEVVHCCGPSANEIRKVLLDIFRRSPLPTGSFLK